MLKMQASFSSSSINQEMEDEYRKVSMVIDGEKNTGPGFERKTILLIWANLASGSAIVPGCDCLSVVFAEFGAPIRHKQ